MDLSNTEERYYQVNKDHFVLLQNSPPDYSRLDRQRSRQFINKMATLQRGMACVFTGYIESATQLI